MKKIISLILLIISYYYCYCQQNSTQANDSIIPIDIWKISQTWEINFPFWTSLIHSFIIVFLSEIADKTFIIILLFTQKNKQVNIFLAALIAILGMNLLSIIIGFSVDQLLYRTIIDYIAFFGLVFYGIAIISEAWEMSSRKVEDKYINFIEDEFKKKKKEDLELHTHLDKNQKNIIYEITDEETDLREPMIYKTDENESRAQFHSRSEGEEEESTGKVLWILISSIVAAECGDKSQISTILISSIFNIYGVFIGSSMALILCVYLNVYYGHKIANYLSEKEINYVFGMILILVGIEIFLIKLNYINLK